MGQVYISYGKCNVLTASETNYGVLQVLKAGQMTKSLNEVRVRSVIGRNWSDKDCHLLVFGDHKNKKADAFLRGVGVSCSPVDYQGQCSGLRAG